MLHVTNPVGTIILDDKNLKAFNLKSGVKQEYQLPMFVFSIVTEILAIGIEQGKT